MNLTHGYLRRNKNAPERLIYFVTNRCNSKCKHCFYWRNLNSKKDELNIEEINKMAESLGEIYELFLSGGEPFMRGDIDEICRIFYEKCKIRHIHIPTNCLLGEKIIRKVREILKKCPGMRIVIGISLEGLEKTNDNLRGVKGHFKKAISLAKKLKEIKNPNLNVYFITTVSKNNINEIPKLAEYLKKNTGLPLDIAPLRGNPKDAHILAPDYKSYDLLLKTINNLKNDSPKGFIQRLSHKKSLYQEKIAVDVLKNNKLPFQCLAGDKIGVIEPNGDVKLCELTPSIGNLRDFNFNFKKLWRSEKAEEMRKSLKNCYCTHGCFIATSLKYSPKELFKCLILNK